MTAPEHPRFFGKFAKAAGSRTLKTEATGLICLLF